MSNWFLEFDGSSFYSPMVSVQCGNHKHTRQYVACSGDLALEMAQ